MRTFVVAALAAGAVLMVGAAPARADHDKVCASAPVGPWLCVWGYQDAVPTEHDDEAAALARAEAVRALDATRELAMSALAEGSDAADAIPEPLCVPGTVICVEGLRANVQWQFNVQAAGAVDLAYCRLYAAVGDLRCVN